MGKSIKVHQKKKVGRPATGRDPAVTIRLPKAVLEAVKAWSLNQDDKPNRSQAIGRLVELGLTVKVWPKQPSRTRAARANELARKAIDGLVDPAAAPTEDAADRKQRLLKGPEEFREVRVDHEKSG